MTCRIVADAIHGSISLNEHEWAVVDTPSFQRLRHLKQLQMAHLTYPNATHSRFAHSLGVFAVMSKVLEVARGPLNLLDEQISELRLAALLHDVGHYPYSHLMEKIDKVQLTEDLTQQAPSGQHEVDLSDASSEPYPKHEPLGELIVTGRADLKDSLGGEERAKRIAALFTRSVAADAQYSKLLHSSLDMDRFDFLLRDAMATGVPYGTVDLHYLLNNVKISPKGMIGFSDKAISAAEQFLFARYFMYKVVYFHKTTYAFEEACRQLLRRSRDQGLFDVPKSGEDIRKWVLGNNFLDFTDAWIDGVIRQAAQHEDPLLSALAKTIVYRRPPKLLREVSELKDISIPGHAEHCRAFLNRCKDRLQNLAQQLKLDLRQFLVAGPVLVMLERRSARLPREEARRLEEEQKDELVKIFERGNEEPESLVDIQRSITRVAADHAYQFVRLYVVCEDEKCVRKAREEVSRW